MLFLCAMISKSKSVSTLYIQKALHACYSFAVEEYLFMNLMTWIYPSLSPRHSFQAEVIGKKLSTFLYDENCTVWKAVTLSTIHLDDMFFSTQHFLMKAGCRCQKAPVIPSTENKFSDHRNHLMDLHSNCTQIALKVIFVILQALFNFQSTTFIIVAND